MSPLTAIDALGRLPASDVKKRGWRGVMRTLRDQGVLVVTNHEEPEAVILSAETYAGILEMAKQADARAASELDALRLQFDRRLAGLRSPDAGGRLRSVLQRPARLRGKVKAGQRD